MLKLLTCLMLLVVVSNASSLLRQDNSHWCCKINVAPLILEQTRVVTVSALKMGKYRCGYQGCGFLGLGTCTKWCETTWIETSSYIEHYTVSQTQPCPQDQITCCSGHYLIHGHCLSLEDINNDPALLAELIQQGILLPEGK